MELPDAVCLVQQHPSHRAVYAPRVPAGGHRVYFSIRTRFVQLRFFTRGVKVLFKKKAEEHTGISPMASFMLSTAMRVGAGNIVGVTGAISTGGPGALFWMWVAAFFGMATSFIESTLSQLFKEKEGNEYVGGLTHYAQRIFGNLRIVGIVIAVLFFIYRLDSVPVHTFHLFTAAASMATSITGEVYSTQSPCTTLWRSSSSSAWDSSCSAA